MRTQKAAAAMLVLAVVLGACGSGSDAPAPGQGNGGVPEAGQLSSTEASPSGSRATTYEVAESRGLKAEVTSPISVLLSWTPVTGATEYWIEASAAGGAWFPVASTGSDVAAFEVVPIPDELEVAFRLNAVQGDGTTTSREVTVTTPHQEPHPYSVRIVVETSGPAVAGFDPSTFDPSTFDPSSLDPSLFDPENFDPASLVPQPATVTQEIGPEGGQIEATSSSGTVYNLTIPEGALLFPREISMTPIASIEGLPPDVELLGAVQIEPTGIDLDAPAVLSFRWPGPTEATPGTMLAGIGFGIDGGDFYFSPIDEEGMGLSSIGRAAKRGRLIGIRQAGAGGSVTTSQLGSRGAVSVPPSVVVSHAMDLSPNNRVGASDLRFAAAWAAFQNQESDQGGSGVTVSSTFGNFMAESLVKRLRNNGTFAELMTAMIDWERLVRENGLEIDTDKQNEVWEILLERVHDLLERGAEAACMSDAHMYGIQVAERLVNPVNAMDRELVKRFNAKYGSDGKRLIDQAHELVKRCPLKLLVYSDITWSDLDRAVSEHTAIIAEVPLTWRFGKSQPDIYLTGRGPITYQTITLMTEEGCEGQPNTKNGSWLVIDRLALVLDPQDKTVKDFSLELYHGTGRMNDITITIAPEDSGCKKGPQGNKGPGGDWWWTNYGAQMILKGFTIRDWGLDAYKETHEVAHRIVEHAGNTIDLGTLDGRTEFYLQLR